MLMGFGFYHYCLLLLNRPSYHHRRVELSSSSALRFFWTAFLAFLKRSRPLNVVKTVAFLPQPRVGVLESSWVASEAGTLEGMSMEIPNPLGMEEQSSRERSQL